MRRSRTLQRETFAAGRAACVVAAALCLLALQGCGEPPRYAKSEKTAATAAATPQAAQPQQPPRTNLPMPPVASSHGARPGASAPGWTLLDGRRETLADYRGRVLVLDLYATYCPPCRDEIPHLVQLQRQFGKQGLQVVGLNVGGPEDRVKVPAYVEDLGILYDLGNPDDAFVDLLSGGETAIPRTYIFDRQGRLVDFSVGYDQTVAARIDRAVQSALETKGVMSDE
jgi:thiol-disulfide isomerase/thioredoxin